MATEVPGENLFREFPQRFASPARRSSWVGLTPKHRESDHVVRRGPNTK